jgi:hypothetical protein
MSGETDLAVLLAGMSPELHDGSYVFVVGKGPEDRRDDALRALRRLAGEG